MKKVGEKKLFFRGDFRQFSHKNVHIWDHVFPLLFPKDSKSLKILDIRLREVGAKRRYLKSEQTDRQTDRRTNTQTDKSTYRKHRPRGPMLWKYIIYNNSKEKGHSLINLGHYFIYPWMNFNLGNLSLGHFTLGTFTLPW